MENKGNVYSSTETILAAMLKQQTEIANALADAASALKELADAVKTTKVAEGAPAKQSEFCDLVKDFANSGDYLKFLNRSTIYGANSVRGEFERSFGRNLSRGESRKLTDAILSAHSELKVDERHIYTLRSA